MYIYLIKELKNTWSKKLRELKEETDKSIIIAGYFNTPLVVNINI